MHHPQSVFSRISSKARGFKISEGQIPPPSKPSLFTQEFAMEIVLLALVEPHTSAAENRVAVAMGRERLYRTVYTRW
jgi:hypothetical protein